MGTKDGTPLLAAVETIAREVAGPAAAAVDAESRFPHEAIEALRAAGALGALVPTEYGGNGSSYTEVAAMCTAIARHCSSAGMVFAMHQIQVACVVENCRGVEHFDGFLQDLAANGRLIASATTERATGGDVRSSSCAVQTDGDKFTLEKDATCISYGAHVDDILVTARRSPDAPASDQVIVHVQAPHLALEPTTTWDALGMRGTASIGFLLQASGHVDQVVPVPYAELSQRTMLPVTHILWGATWLGIAEAALDRARAFVRAAARKTPGATPPGARHLVHAQALLERMRALVAAGIAEYLEASGDMERMSSMQFALHMNDLKLSLSHDMVSVVQTALTVCGLSGYRNDSDYSVGRLLRDALSASLMVHNDRIVEHNATLLCAVKNP